MARHRRTSGPPKLLTLETAYPLEEIRALRLEHDILCRDLDGFFAHVWSVHPAVGASPRHPSASAVGSATSTEVAPLHTFIEGTVARFKWLSRFPRLNFALAQADLLLRLLSLIRAEGISLIRASDPFYAGVLGWLLARLSRLPLVVRVNANADFMYEATGQVSFPRLLPTRALEKRVARFVFQRADLVAAGNEDNRQFALANGARAERSTLFRAGTWVDPVHFEREPAARPSVSEELELGERPFMVLVSRLEPVKFPDDMLAVLVTAKAKHPELAAVFVGDGTMRRELESRAADLGVSDDVRFAGNREQPWVAAALASASVVLSPITGRALVEACLSGTPVVAYDVEWHSELVAPGETGVLVPYRDTEEMARAVCELLDDPDRAVQLGQSARARTLDMMDPVKLREHERAEYRKLLGRGERREGVRRGRLEETSSLGPPPPAGRVSNRSTVVSGRAPEATFPG